jgi:hypothetical protein
MGYLAYDESDRIGTVSVDSGQIMLVDPSYIRKGAAYMKLFNESCANDGKVMKGAAIIVDTQDDGVYPVFRVGKQIIIDLDYEEEDEAE